MKTCPPLTIYTKASCTFCTTLKTFLSERGIAYKELVLGENFSPDQFLNMFGRGTTFPQVKTDFKIIGGLRDTITYLIENKILTQ
jgi:glutaredoxin